MRAIKTMRIGAVGAALVLISAAAVIGQDEASEGGPSPYFYGTGEGTLVPDMGNPAGCDIGYTSVTTMTGQSTLLGDYTVEWSNCYVPTDTLENVHDGSWTFTAENGDTLTGAGPGDCIPDSIDAVGDVWTCYATISVTGGSGAFEGASGEIHTMGEIVNSGAGEGHPATAMFEGIIES